MRTVLCLLLVTWPAWGAPTPVGVSVASEDDAVQPQQVTAWTLADLRPAPDAPKPAALPPDLEPLLRQRFLQTRLALDDRTAPLLRRQKLKLPKGLTPPPKPAEEIQLWLTTDPETGALQALFHLTWVQLWLGPALEARDCPPCPCSPGAGCAPCVACVPKQHRPEDRPLAVIGYTLAVRYTVEPSGRLTAETHYLPKPLTQPDVARRAQRWRAAQRRRPRLNEPGQAF